jgi:hypothetical protein
MTRVARSLLNFLRVCFIASTAAALPWLLSAPTAASDLPAAPSGIEGDYAAIDWRLLAGFDYEDPKPGTLKGLDAAALARRNADLPKKVRALHGKPIALRGYLIPARMDAQGRVSEFMLSAKNDLGCCFGFGVKMNEWVYVTLAPGADPPSDEPLALVTALGSFDVGEEVKNGSVYSLYRMTADRVRAEEAAR